MTNKFNVIVNTRILSHILSLAGSTIDKRNILPILNNFKLTAKHNNLIITATDMDLSVVQEMEANIISEGEITLDSSIFSDIIRKIPDEEVALNCLEKSVEIKTKNCQFNLPILPAEEYPSMDDMHSKIQFKLDSKNIVQLLEQTKFSMSDEETRYNLNGIYFHSKPNNILACAATDAHRLAFSSVKLNEKLESFGVIIPKKAVTEIYKIFKDSRYSNFLAEISLGSNRISIKTQGMKLISKLIDAQFPEYSSFFPQDNYNSLRINAKFFSKTVDRADTVTMDKMKVIKLSLSESNLEVEAYDEIKGTAREKIEVVVNDESSQKTESKNDYKNYASYKGEPLVIGFNTKYIMDALIALDDQDIDFKIKDPYSPVSITPKNSNMCIFVIMPMKV